MRYRLRTLLLVLALGPPALAFILIVVLYFVEEHRYNHALRAKYRNTTASPSAS